MYTKNTKRSVAFVLTVSMFLIVLVGFMPEAIALENEKASEEIFVLPDAAETLEEAEYFVERLSELETDLNTLAFKNIDGTTTIKVFGHPVKYIDEAGIVKDISTEVERLFGGDYRTVANNIVTTFADRLSEGITLEYNDIEINMTPSTPTGVSPVTYFLFGSNAHSSDGETVFYPYGSKTRLEYQLTYTGFKEEIVVSEYTGQTEYTFTLETNGLFLREENGSYYLADENGVKKATIGDIIIFTADERNNTFGYMTAKTVTEAQKYELTIHVDEAYLKDEKTAYPIRIDPTIEINYETYGVGAIEDVTVNSADVLPATSGSVSLGKYAEDNSVSRILMTFPGLDLSEQLHTNLLLKAEVSLRDLMPGTPETVVSCYRFDGSVWSEALGATWSGVNATLYTDLQSSHTVSYANGLEQATDYRYWFDITDALIDWGLGNASQDKGLLFKASDTTEEGTTHVYKTFGSYNRASYKPQLTLTFRDQDGEAVVVTPVNHTEEAFKYISVSTTLSGEDFKVYEFKPPVTGEYSFWTTGAADEDVYIDIYTGANLLSSNIRTTSRYTGSSDWNDPTEGDYALIYDMNSLITYYIVVYSVDPTEAVTFTFNCVRGLPLSGSEIPYQPELWNDGNIGDIQQNTYCYNYALNTQLQQTGRDATGIVVGQSVLGNTQGSEEDYAIDGRALVDYVECDSEAWGFEFEPVTRNQICEVGTYKVAFIIDPYEGEEDFSYDYHWYRQNPDGTWSHKLATSAVVDFDADSKIIFDPQNADCDYSEYYGLSYYSYFVGYFQVSPLPLNDSQIETN